MGTRGWAAAAGIRTRSALYFAVLFRPELYFVHRNSGTAWAAIDSATVFGTHGSAEADRCRLPAFGGGPSADRGEKIDGGAAFGPVAMTVPGAGKNRTGGGGDVGGGGSSDEESSLRRARPRLFRRTRRCGGFGAGRVGMGACGGAGAAGGGCCGGVHGLVGGGAGAAGGGCGSVHAFAGGGVGGVRGLCVVVLGALEVVPTGGAVDEDAVADWSGATALLNRVANIGAFSLLRNSSFRAICPSVILFNFSATPPLASLISLCKVSR